MAYTGTQETTSGTDSGTTEPDEPDASTTEGEDESAVLDLDPDGWLARVSDVMAAISDVLAPFTDLLTVVVNGATAWALVTRA
jgi:hypothetical protein